MANKRDTSKQKRARQNRAQREALKARAEAASVPAEERRTTATKADAGDAAASGKKRTRTPAPRGPRPGDVPVDLDTLEGSWIAKRMAVPGGRHVLSALLLSVLLSVMLAFQKYPPANAPADAKATESIFDLLGPFAFFLLLFPVVVVGIAAQFTLHPKHRRIWLGCTIVLGASVLAMVQLYIVHLVVVGYLIYAMQRAKKVEGPYGAPRTTTDDDAGDTSDGDVDVEVNVNVKVDKRGPRASGTDA